MPEISVVLTSFNHEKYIAETIDSILAQSFRKFELIIWDDFSSDRSWDIIRSYHDPRIRAFRNEERRRGFYGINRAINEVAEGPYIAIHHSDDVWEPHKLERQYTFLQKHPEIGAVFTHARAIGEDSQPLDDAQHYYARIFQQTNRSRQQWLNRFFYAGNALCHPSVLIRKLCYDDCGLYKPWLPQLGDLDMWMRLCLKYEIHILQEPLVRFRVRDNEANASGNRPETRNRHGNESMNLLDNYRQLNDIEQLIKVFPNALQYRRGDNSEPMFALAMVALAEQNALWHSQFGLRLLYELVSDVAVSSRLKQHYQFDYQTLISLSGKFAVFGNTLPAISTPELKATSPLQPWLESVRWSPAEQRWAEETIAQWPPFSCEFVLVKRHESDSADLSIASLRHQWLTTRWQVMTLEKSLVKGLNQVMLQGDSEWVAIIDAGDTLAADATFRLAQAVYTHPEWQIIYSDEDTISADGHHTPPHCKPDFNLDLLRSMPYIGNLIVIRRSLFTELGGFDPLSVGAEEYDLLLRAWEHIGHVGIGHVPEVLYHRRQDSPGRIPISMEQMLQSCEQSLARHLDRLHIRASVLRGPFPPAFRVRYERERTPQVTIIVPTRNQLPLLCRCLESIIEKTHYPAYEIIVVDNGSDDAQTCAYLDLLDQHPEASGQRIRVLRHPGEFNFSAMNNRAAEIAKGELLLLLNNDTGVLHEDWLDEMVGHSLRPEVGAVGAKLLFPDGKIQHAGVILGMNGPADHLYVGHDADFPGHLGRTQLTQNYSAVTGACLLIRKSLYDQLGGLDESTFKVSYNDIDLCLKIRESGYLIVWTPWAILLHEGSASQKADVEAHLDEEKPKRFQNEKQAFYQRWLPQLSFDPAYNRHLSLCNTDVQFEDQAPLTWDISWRPRHRILVHPSDREGCGEYRVIAPMRALRNAGMVQGWETMRFFQPSEIERFMPDSMVFQRPFDEEQLASLERQSKLIKTFRILELDDLITNLPIKSIHKSHIHKNIPKLMRKAASLCDRFLVSTESLAQAYQGLAEDIRVQPNYLDNAAWGSLKPQRRNNTRPRIGWAGGIGHTGDLEMIVDVVRDLAHEVEWVFFGMCPEALMPYVSEIHQAVVLSEYPSKLASLDLDLAIAPLEDNPFNRAKSTLRLLEYGVLGFPVICSDIVPYQNDIPAWRVANRYRDWIKTIRELISEREALAKAGDEIRAHIRTHWMLEDHLDDWLKAWLP
ncbi:glycosyltransferase [Ferrovum sp.]|uniref:glycosyltransferase n=1 Tax=Ferrovum sp. TaxID=2609467 RepID=UPI002622D22C|nr:glycosyltransferase [Ferrovum sp.]